MKIIKSYLIFLILFSFVCFGTFYFLKSNALKNFETLNQDVNQKWNNYISILNERNSCLSKQKLQNDSLTYYIEKGNLISLLENSKKFEYNEYKLNKFIAIDSSLLALNNSLNLKLKAYNDAAKSYNFYKIRFPNFWIARKTKFNKTFKYFEIQYGIDNDQTMRKKEKRENWVKNGGDYPY